jgi:hypothetical protein
MTKESLHKRRLSKAIEHVQQQWEHYRALGRKGHSAVGRGSIVLDLGTEYCPTGTAGPSRVYADKALLEEQIPDPFAILVRLYDYNPERELLFTFLDYAAEKAQVLILGEREDGKPYGKGFESLRGKEQPVGDSVPPIVLEVPDSTSAQDFDQLNHITTDIVSRKGVDALNPNERVIWDVLELRYQVENGGFEQFFTNCPDAWQRTAQALDRAGAIEISRLFSRVCASFPGGRPGEPDGVIEKLDEMADGNEDLWDEEDRAFYELEDDLPRILWQFWSNQMEQEKAQREDEGERG